MAEQRVNAAGQVVEFNENSQRWEPVKEDVKSEEKEQEETATDETESKDEGKPVSFNYTPRTDK